MKKCSPTTPCSGRRLRSPSSTRWCTCPLDLVGGLVLALLINQKLRGVGVFRTVYYLPSVLPGVALS